MRFDKDLLRKVGVTACLILATSLLAAAQQPAQLEGKTAEQAFKNIQVLKGIPADQLIPTMRFMRDSLGGVACTFCHADEDRASDEKPQKVTARKMIAMEIAINKNTFNGETTVTCYTCHRGSPMPVGTPVIPEEKPGEAAAGKEKAPNLPSADEIVASYINALGGEQALRKVTSRVETGTIDLPAAAGNPAAQGTVEFDAKAPNLSLLVVSAGKASSTNGFDGTTAWTKDNRGRVMQATGVDLARASRASDFYEPLDLKKEYDALVVRGVEKIGDRSVYHVEGVPKGDNPEQLYFDTQSGLLVRRIVALTTPMGDDPVYTDYGDYRDVGDGVKVPFLVANYTWTQKTTTHLDKVQDNVPVDNGKFNQPPPKSAPAAGQ